MKYLLNNEIISEQEFWSEFESSIYNYVEENIDDIIDETNEEVNIGALTYSPSEVLKTVDPIAYNCYISDMVSNYYGDFKYDLEREEEVEIDGNSFQIIEDESEVE